MNIVGIDPSSKSIGAALFCDGRLEKIDFLEAGSKSEGRAEELWQKYLVWLNDTMDDLQDNINAVIIERTVYMQNIKSTLKIAEVAFAVKFASLDLRVPYVAMIENTSWKKLLIGNGRAAKEDIANWFNLRWPGYKANQDQIDAAAIGYWGVLTLDDK